MPCTDKIHYYPITLKGTNQKVVFIDTVGLDQDEDEQNLKNIEDSISKQENV